jgi:hypothetical protein
MSGIHISQGGATYAIHAMKLHYFEDHPVMGPLFISKTGEGKQDPSPTDHIWLHINTWYRQGKQYNEMGGFRWCKYKTDLQESRDIAKAAREAIESANDIKEKP